MLSQRYMNMRVVSVDDITRVIQASFFEDQRNCYLISAYCTGTGLFLCLRLTHNVYYGTERG